MANKKPNPHLEAYKMYMHRDVIHKKAKNEVRDWCLAHKDFVLHLKHLRFAINKGEIPGVFRFDERVVENELAAAGFHDVPFSPQVFLAFWEA